MHEVLEESWEKCPNIIIENKEGQVAQWYNDEIIATVYRYNYDIERLSILLKKINKKIY